MNESNLNKKQRKFTYLKMALIKNGGMFTIRLLISEKGVRFLCLS
jgi:hypothetical protein